MKIRLFAKAVWLTAILTTLCGADAASARDYSNWMKELPDEAYVTTLSIPGTHDSATGHGFTDAITGSFSQTQDMTIAQQLEIGVRAFDYRPGRDNAGSLIKPDYRVRCFHGSAKIKYWFDDAMDDMCAWLDSHPDEFLVIHLYKATDNTNKDLSAMLQAIMDKDDIAGHIAAFRPNLKVKDLRGKILFLKRYVVDWSNGDIAWLWDWNETDWATNEMIIKNGGYEEHKGRIVMQDKANTSPEDKVARFGELLNYFSTYTPANDRDMLWCMNFASSYNGTTSSSKTYCENASQVNPAIINLLDGITGPTGIVMLDWVGDNEHKPTVTNKYYTQGETLVKKIVDNNFKYIDRLCATPAVAAPQYKDADLGDAISDKLFQGNVNWMDVNSDGLKDLVVKGRDLADGWWPKYQVMLNDGGALAKATDLPRVAFSNDYDENAARVVIPVDYNADGHIDMIYGCSAGSMLLENDGGGRFFEPCNDDGSRKFTLYGQDINLGANLEDRGTQGLMFAVDFDLDGYPDILTYHGGDEGIDGAPFMFRNESNVFGCAFFGKHCDIPALRHGSMAVGDYDRDGAPDVLVSGVNDSGARQASICLNRGFDGESFRFEVLTPSELQPYATDRGAVAMADVNNDGRLDIFITGRLRDKVDNGDVDRTSYAANLFISQADGSLQRQCMPTVPVCSSGIDWCDINGDGYVDIVYGGQTRIFNGINGSKDYIDAVSVILMNQGDGSFSCHADILAPMRSGVSTAVCDYDGSGTPAIAMMGYGDKTFRLYQADAPKPSSRRPAASTPRAVTPVIEKTDGGKTRLSWDGADDGTRYNYVLVNRNGDVHSAVPVNPATGKVLSSDIDAATTGSSVTVAVNYDDIASYGVVALSAAKQEGPLALADIPLTPSGTDAVRTDAIESDEAMPVEYFTIQGAKVTTPSSGVFIERRGASVTKRVFR